MSRPKLLDLFCGAGGAAMGYHRAGFDVVGVDINPQPRYPFEFHQADAMTYPLDGFDAIHASPPCQMYSRTRSLAVTRNRVSLREHPDLVAATRDRLVESGLPFVIENVVGAPLIEPTMLCGEMFGLRVIRHRLFESAFLLLRPSHSRHVGRVGYGNVAPAERYYLPVYGHERGKREWGSAMGIDWMKAPELAQAIPPAYTEFIGAQLIRAVEKVA